MSIELLLLLLLPACRRQKDNGRVRKKQNYVNIKKKNSHRKLIVQRSFSNWCLCDYLAVVRLKYTSQKWNKTKYRKDSCVHVYQYHLSRIFLYVSTLLLSFQFHPKRYQLNELNPELYIQSERFPKIGVFVK